MNSEQIISVSATSETPEGKIYLHLSFKKRYQNINPGSRGRVCVFLCACTVNLRISLAAYCSSVNFDWWFFFVFLLQRRQPRTFPSCLLKTNNKPLADINGTDENSGAISAGTALRTCLCLCASSPAAPLTLNYLAAVTTNQSNYRSRTVCSCSYCTASCISFEMYEVYILSLLFI